MRLEEKLFCIREKSNEFQLYSSCLEEVDFFGEEDGVSCFSIFFIILAITFSHMASAIFLAILAAFFLAIFLAILLASFFTSSLPLHISPSQCFHPNSKSCMCSCSRGVQPR